jgi:Uma2 family endonuclease
VAVVAGEPKTYKTRHPGPAKVALLADVAESTLDRYRGEKLRTYATSGIAVYRVVNLVDRRIEVYSQPVHGAYQTHNDFLPGQDVPVFVAGTAFGQIAVANVFP